VVWVGPWRFKKRLLKRLVHGRVIFLGDAAHEHSPFGARGGNSGIQDANNLAWKLALVLQAKAPAELLGTYEQERHFAARDNTENATRSAIFIGPQSVGQRLVRNAILDLAQREPWARRWVNVGRLSVATVYEDSALNSEKGQFTSSLARPGAAAPDARVADGYFVDRLGGEFRTVFFRAQERSEPLYSRYGVPAEGATYVFRPDGHVLARCTGIDESFARQAMERLLDCSGQRSERSAEEGLGQVQIDRLYDAFSEFFDAHNGDREIAAQCVRLAEKAGSYGAVRDAVRQSRSALELVSRLTK
jgi:3-(3-hydroxy-phenyl)propionate hydroxylase